MKKKSLKDLDLTRLSFDILLNVIRTENAEKCVDSAQTILIAVKGLSRIIERMSSKSDFIDANQLNDIFEQMIGWSLYQLNGAPIKKTIVRENLPEEFIPDDELIRQGPNWLLEIYIL